MEGLLIVALAPIAVGIAIGVVVGTVKGLVAALLRSPTGSEPKPEGEAGEAESETQRPRRKLATEVRRRDKISMDDVVDPDSNEGSIMHLSEDEIIEYARQERIPF